MGANVTRTRSAAGGLLKARAPLSLLGWTTVFLMLLMPHLGQLAWVRYGGEAHAEMAPADEVQPSAPKDEVARRVEQKLIELREHSRRAMEERLAQQRVSPEQEAATRAERLRSQLRPGEPIWLQSGKSRVLELAAPLKRVSVGDPELAGIVVLTPRTIMINAKELPKRSPQATLGASAGSMGKTLTPEPRMAETSIVIWDANEGHDVHTLVVADFVDEQVMLEVTVAELRRTALEEHGIDVRVAQRDFISAYFMGGGAGSSVPGSVTTVPPQILQPLLPLTQTTDSPTYAFILPDEDITGFIKALQAEGLATILAQPKIMALSGQTAAFQVGGEIPIRVATGFAVDVVFKPFGTLVNFVPRVSDDGEILLTVTPEVSTPDFSQTVEDIPSFRTRRASTSARMRNGETLVMGGLLQNVRTEEIRGVPFLMNIPVLGYLFKKTSYDEETTELWIVVTPTLVRPLPSGPMAELPTDSPPLTHRGRY
jgi:Flp pilus assembly secretin CpaC